MAFTQLPVIKNKPLGGSGGGGGLRPPPGWMTASGGAGGGYTNQTVTSGGPGYRPPLANGLINQYGATLQNQLATNASDYASQVAIADQLRKEQLAALQGSTASDLARLQEQKYRDVDLAYQSAAAQEAENAKQFDILQGRHAAELARIDQQAAALRAQYEADVGYSQGAVGQNISTRERLKREEFAAQSKYLDWQKANLGTLTGFLEESYKLGTSAAASSEQLGSRAALLEAQSSNQIADMQRRGSTRVLTSDVAARGAAGSVGFRQGMGEIGEQYQQSVETTGKKYDIAKDSIAAQYQQALGQLGLKRSEGYNAIEAQRQGLTFETEKARTGFEEAQAGFGLERAGLQKSIDDMRRQYESAEAAKAYEKGEAQAGFESASASREQQAAEEKITRDTLASIGREYGIREGDVQNALKQSVTRAGLDYNATIQQLTRQLASNNAAAQQQAINFMTQLMINA